VKNKRGEVQVAKTFICISRHVPSCIRSTFIGLESPLYPETGGTNSLKNRHIAVTAQPGDGAMTGKRRLTLWLAYMRHLARFNRVLRLINSSRGVRCLSGTEKDSDIGKLRLPIAKILRSRRGSL
jgi:hypothetical protein